MDSLSHEILAVLLPFSVLFSKPSWQKATTLVFGTLLCTGRRTVCAALRAMGLTEDEGFSRYHQVLNRTKWSALEAANILLVMLLTLIPDGSPLVIFVDETLERRRGKKIKAKGYYRDAVRSSKTQVVKTSGLKWLVMAASVKLPFMPRTLALPFLSVLEFSKKYDEKRKRPHKTTLQWTRQMLSQVRRWIGNKRRLILVGDGGFAAGQLAWDCIRHGVALVSRLKMNAQLFDFPPEHKPCRRGRIALKGRKLVNFKQMLEMEGLPWQEAEITGYSGVRRKVRFLSTTCMWGSEGSMPVPIRWVLVMDPTGQMDPLPLMSTDPLMIPEQIIELYIDRWSLEVTFEESREHLGVETQRQWSDKAIARSTPILLGLYSIVCLVANRLGQSKVVEAEKTAWYRKEHVTFSDLLRTVRMGLWRDNLFFQKGKMGPSVENITPEMKEWAEAIMKRLLQAA
jgi:hypothetical protein